MDGRCLIDTALKEFQEVSQNPENFLNYEESFSQKIKSNMKTVYDILNIEKLLSRSALPELLIKDFETEQIWQQIELQNEDSSNKCISNTSRVLMNKTHLVFENIVENDKNETDQENETSDGSKNSSDEEYESEHQWDKTKELFESDDDLLSDENGKGQTSDNEGLENKPSSGKRSIVDDDFFKLEEMESFLKSEENKLEGKNLGNEDESDSDEGSIDLFKSDSDEEDDVRKAKFKDFFVSKTDDDKPSKRNKFLEEMESDNEETVKSSFELRQERLQRKIEEIEESNINEKPWTLKGEISADNRPQNSLLEEVVEFDLTSKPAPVITENVTHQLEDIIRDRIKNKLFDSVERKEKPVETLLEYKKKIVLDQEKSKHSLAQIYEKEFLDQQMTLDSENGEKKEEEPELHKEIKSMMKELFNKLDALSNFHFTPKPAVPELKVVTNLPAIVMEEVAPVTVSDGGLLAPEEIRNKPKGDIIGKSERTKTDKKRERRKKKLKQKLHVQKTINKNLLTGKKVPNQVISNKKNMQKMTETLDKKNFKSSTAFFTQLQEQVQSSIKSVKNSKPSKNSNKKLSAKKLKL